MNTTTILNTDDADLVVNTILRVMDDILEKASTEEPSRGHLGMSQIGHEDARTLWFKFRWSMPDELKARTLRIFRLGNLVEDETATLLRLIPGLELHTDQDGKQFSFHALGGHFSGSMDGCLVGIPEAPKTWHVWEAKSAKDKKFKELIKAGSIKKWNKTYWTQAQCYMGVSGMHRCLFTVYNKDTSEIFSERIRLDKTIWPAMVAHAERIISADEPPKSSYPNREFYKVRFMTDLQQAIYWGDRLPEPNCRNCRFSTPILEGEDARWHCSRENNLLSLKQQRAGCQSHNWLPALVPARPVKIYPDFIIYETSDGLQFSNVDDDATASVDSYVFSSWELTHLSQWELTAKTLTTAMAELRKPSFEDDIPF